MNITVISTFIMCLTQAFFCRKPKYPTILLRLIPIENDINLTFFGSLYGVFFCICGIIVF